MNKVLYDPLACISATRSSISSRVDSSMYGYWRYENKPFELVSWLVPQSVTMFSLELAIHSCFQRRMEEEQRGASAGHDGRDASQLCGASAADGGDDSAAGGSECEFGGGERGGTTEGAGSVAAMKLALGAAATKASAISYISIMDN